MRLRRMRWFMFFGVLVGVLHEVDVGFFSLSSFSLFVFHFSLNKKFRFLSRFFISFFFFSFNLFAHFVSSFSCILTSRRNLKN